MRKPAIFITGAIGEIGKRLIESVYKNNPLQIVTLDLNILEHNIAEMVTEEITGNILDTDLIDQLNGKYQFEIIYHYRLF